MNAQVLTEMVQVHTDSRGMVFESLPGQLLPHHHNVHLVVTYPGRVRGNHYHERGTESVVVVGPALVRYRVSGREHDVEVGQGEVVRFTFPPGVPHAFKNTGSGPMLLVSFNTTVFAPAAPDTIPFALLD